MLVRMRELAVQSASGTYSQTDRDALELEFAALMAEVTRIQENTQWNGMALMDAGPNAVTIQLGASASQTMTVTFKDWGLASAGALGADISSLTIDDDTSATAAIADATASITALDAAITSATAEQAAYGAYLSRLTHASDNLANVSTNLDQSRSRIEDADYAVETTELARTQIIAQASTAMLAQANQVKQTVLALLQ